MQVLHMEQGTAEWHEARRCKVSGTKLEDIMGTPYAKIQLIARFIAEEATEQVPVNKQTPEMERGLGEEAFAIKLFEKQTGKKVEQVGLCISDEMPFNVLSPDGLIENNGKYTEAVEVKSPMSQTAIFYQMCNAISAAELGLTPAKRPFLGVPADYKWQVVNYFLVNPDLERLYFLVYDVRFIDDKLKLFTVVVERRNELLQEAVQQAREALQSFHAEWQKYKEIILPTNF